MPTTADQELDTAAALIRLLGAAAHAYMLDEHGEVERLLGQVTKPACDRVAWILSTMADVQRMPEPVFAENVVLLRR